MYKLHDHKCCDNSMSTNLYDHVTYSNMHEQIPCKQLIILIIINYNT